MNSYENRSRGFALSAIIAIALILSPGADRARAQGKSKQKVDYGSLFVSIISESSTEEIGATAEKFSDKDSAMLEACLTTEKTVDELFAGIDAEKAEAIKKKITCEKVSNPSEADCRNALINVMSSYYTVLSPERIAKITKAVPKEEMAKITLAMGVDGRAKLLGPLPDAKVAAVLDNTDAGVLIAVGRQRLAELNNYTATFIKQERVDGELQGVETIELKLRHSPQAVYMKWIDGPYESRELLFNEKDFSKTEIRVREAGILGVFPVTLDYKSDLAKRGSNHTAVETGLQFMLDMIERDYKLATERGELKRINHGIVKIDGRRLYKMETVLPKKPDIYYKWRAVHFIDFIYSLETRNDVYDFDEGLFESYYYSNIKFNPKVAPLDFSVDNPDYRF